MQLSQAKLNATDAYKRAEAALQQANSYFNRTKNMINDGNDLIGNLSAILNNKTASPQEIEKLANEVSVRMKIRSKKTAQNINFNIFCRLCL